MLIHRSARAPGAVQNSYVMFLLQVADLQINLKTEQEVVEEKKARTTALIENIGQEKATVDEAVESSRADEEAAAALQVRGFLDQGFPIRLRCRV